MEVTVTLRRAGGCEGCGLVREEEGCAGGRSSVTTHPCVSQSAESGAVGSTAPGHRVVGWQFRRSLGVWVLMEGVRAGGRGGFGAEEGVPGWVARAESVPEARGRPVPPSGERWQTLGRGHRVDLEPDPEGPRTKHRSREPWGCERGRGTARPRYLGLLLEASEGATPAGVCLAAWHLQRVDCGSPEDQPLPRKPRPPLPAV